ncbi:MAG: hypothetical protein JXR78_02175 [Victivallales bacterium]|nr:hypothetical protein [Victivallales bacterium]
MKKILFAGVSVFTLVCSVFAAPEKQPTIAILPFKVGANTSISEIGQVRITREIVENEFTNQLTEFLVRSRKFNVLNRTDINRIMDENKLTESEWAQPGQEQRVGKLLVADYLVTGNINRLEFNLIKQNIKITGETAPRLVATFKTQYRITEVATGKVVAAGQITEVLRSADVRREIPAQERRDWTMSDYKDMLFNKAAVRVGNDVLAGIYPVKIASVDGSEVIINRGDGAGIAPGQIYLVFNVGEAVIDPDTGENLGSAEKKIAEISVTAVNPKFSKAKIISQTGEVQSGAVCRLKADVKQEAAPAYPRATPGW